MSATIDIYIDFNTVDPSGLVLTRLRGPVAVSLGDVVLVGDGEGMTAKGQVTKLTPSGWVGVQLDGSFQRKDDLIGSSALTV